MSSDGEGSKGEASGGDLRVVYGAPPKLLRLRSLVVPILEEYVVRGEILEMDTDVALHCSGGIVRAHKVVLALVSNFFSNLFRSQSEDALIIIPDIKLDVLQAIINLCYKKEVMLDASIVPEVAQWLTQFGLRLQDFIFGTTPGIEKTPLSNNDSAQSKVEFVFTPKAGGSASQPANNEVENGAEDCTEGRVEVAMPTFWLDLDSCEQDDPFNVMEAYETPERNIASGSVLRQGKKVVPVVKEAPVSYSASDTSSVNVPAALHGIPPGTPVPRILKGAEKIPEKVCPVCGCAFSNDTQWKWHTKRHLKNGLFKCAVCRRTFNSSRNVYHHETTVHKISGLPVSTPEGNEQLECGEQQMKTTRLKSKTGGSVNHHRPKFRPLRVTPLKIKAASKIHAPGRRGRKPKWAVEKVVSPGANNESPRKDGTKVRWVYICKKCKHSSDSSIKAYAHYVKCRESSEQKYEDTVQRCRQGHFGDYECPLCTKQYNTIQGFVVHCMHTHKDYRKSFSHIINEDKLLCIQCGGTFPNPKDFHNHLNLETQLCERPNHQQQLKKPVRKSLSRAPSEERLKCIEPKIYLRDVFESISAKKAEALRREAEGEEGKTKSLKRKLSRTENFEDPRKELFKKIVSTNPRSLRLQNRLAAAATEEVVVEKPPQKSEVMCAICGLTVGNLKSHLHLDHNDMKMDFEIVEDSIFRCNLCCISFASWDLLAHYRSCTGKQQPVGPLQIPPDVGVSPVLLIGARDLMSIETVKEALSCPVCKQKARKLHVISECLRSHGVYRCTLCFNTYLTKEDHIDHMRNCHMNDRKQIICPICDLARSNIGQVTSHVYATHWSNFFRKSSTSVVEPKETDNQQVDENTCYSLHNTPVKETHPADSNGNDDSSEEE